MNKKTEVVWITGASSGIGAELARQYSNFGAKMILSSRKKGSKKNRYNCIVYSNKNIFY